LLPNDPLTVKTGTLAVNRLRADRLLPNRPLSAKDPAVAEGVGAVLRMSHLSALNHSAKAMHPSMAGLPSTHRHRSVRMYRWRTTALQPAGQLIRRRERGLSPEPVVAYRILLSTASGTLDTTVFRPFGTEARAGIRAGAGSDGCREDARVVFGVPPAMTFFPATMDSPALRQMFRPRADHAE